MKINVNSNMNGNSKNINSDGTQKEDLQNIE